MHLLSHLPNSESRTLQDCSGFYLFCCRYLQQLLAPHELGVEQTIQRLLLPNQLEYTECKLELSIPESFNIQYIPISHETKINHYQYSGYITKQLQQKLQGRTASYITAERILFPDKIQGGAITGQHPV